MSQLYAKDGRLHLVQAGVHAPDFADVPSTWLPTIVPQHRNLVRQGIIVGRDCAAVAIGAQVLGGVKGEGRGISERPDHLSLPTRAVGLSAVLDHFEVVGSREFHDRPHIGRLAIQVNRDNCTGPGSELRLQFVRVHIEGHWVDVTEDRSCAGRRNGDSSCNRCV